jgi:hypothetical protein
MRPEIDLFGRLDASQYLEAGKKRAFAKKEPIGDKLVA